MSGNPLANLCPYIYVFYNSHPDTSYWDMIMYIFTHSHVLVKLYSYTNAKDEGLWITECLKKIILLYVSHYVHMYNRELIKYISLT